MVVVPSSVLENWDSELKKFCPSLNTVKYHGSQKERAKMRQSLNAVSSGAAREDMPVRDFGTSSWGHSTSDRCQKQSKRFKEGRAGCESSPARKGWSNLRGYHTHPGMFEGYPRSFSPANHRLGGHSRI